MLILILGSGTLFHLDPDGSGRGLVHSREGVGGCVGGWEGGRERVFFLHLSCLTVTSDAARIP